MKKTLKILPLVLIAVLAIGTFVACGGSSPSDDPVKAKKALEDAGYEVDATIASNSDEEKDDLDQTAQRADLKAGDMVAIIGAYKIEVGGNIGDLTSFEDLIYIYYFKDGDVANKFWNAHKDDFEESANVLKEAIDKDIKYKQSGSIIYIGTEQTIKDAQ